MTEKIAFCKTQGIIYYYPGYISTDTSRFDYKVFPSEKHVEIYNDVEWLPYSKNTLITLNNGRKEEYPDGLIFNEDPEE
jgi:arginine-tRNA-protein transferase